MYGRKKGERTLTFDFGQGLVRDNLLVVDRETSSVWSQLHGKAIAGPLAGEPMEVVPALQTTWAFWRVRQPETRVVQIEAVESRTFRYRSRESKADSDTDPQPHDTSALGLGLARNGEALFAPLDVLTERSEPLPLELGGARVTLHAAPQGLTAWAEDGEGRLLPGILAYRSGWLSFYPDSRILGSEDASRGGMAGDASARAGDVAR